MRKPRYNENLTPYDTIKIKIENPKISFRVAPKTYMIRSENKKQRDYLKKHRINIPPTYTLLQYLKQVMVWAMSKYDIGRSTVEYTLYLAPIGVFTKEEAYAAIRIFPHSNPNLVWTVLIESRMVVVADDLKHDGKRYVNYMLSHKAKNMVRSMHEMLMGIREIPNSPITEIAMRTHRTTPRHKSNQDYSRIIAKMNERIRKENTE